MTTSSRTSSTTANAAPEAEDTASLDENRDVGRAIRDASIAAAAFGVLLSPIPLADEIILMPVYGVLTARIARARGVSLRAVPWRPIALTAVAGLGARAAINLTVSYIPVVAAVANAASGIVLTRFLGHFVDTACETARRGGETSPLGIKDIADKLRPQAAKA